ncbi:MAPEG family protein [Variovorax ureilyticus]|uniref:MAPEG family protein n=1 Tax=Variovorax ureilyticus TaxID=1836198 RepID=A0ABU8V7W3_9BURK
MPIVWLYAALLALLFVGLSFRTLVMRRRLRIVIGDAGDERMLRAMRVHSNFAEYVPLNLLLMYFVSSTLPQPWFLHALGISILLGRVLHAVGVSQIRERYGFRVTGMALTFAPMLASALTLLASYGRTGSG